MCSWLGRRSLDFFLWCYCVVIWTLSLPICVCSIPPSLSFLERILYILELFHHLKRGGTSDYCFFELQHGIFFLPQHSKIPLKTHTVIHFPLLSCHFPEWFKCSYSIIVRYSITTFTMFCGTCTFTGRHCSLLSRYKFQLFRSISSHPLICSPSHSSIIIIYNLY